MPIFRGFSVNKKAAAFCNCLIFRAESGTRTRDLFITSETLYHLSYFGTATDVDSVLVALYQTVATANVVLSDLYFLSRFLPWGKLSGKHFALWAG